VFDLDGVLVDSEPVWDEARQELVAQYGGVWRPEATRAMQGMSSPVWTAYLHDTLGVPLSTDEIGDHVVAFVRRHYEAGLPLLPGAPETVRELATAWPLGLASSSNRSIIDFVLDVSGLAACFSTSVSSEEVARGKPAPDVYLEAARRLGVPADECVAVEDSTNGILAGIAAGMAVIAVPNVHFPPEAGALDAATVVLERLSELTTEVVLFSARSR
jgi:HAD superfamily hydrolase (TIGR01509 family)